MIGGIPGNQDIFLRNQFRLIISTFLKCHKSETQTLTLMDNGNVQNVFIIRGHIKRPCIVVNQIILKTSSASQMEPQAI